MDAQTLAYVFVLKRSYICYYIIRMTLPLRFIKKSILIFFIAKLA